MTPAFKPDTKLTALWREPGDIVIDAASSNDFAAVKSLIIQGLTERWSTYEAAFNPDLDDFAATYHKALVVVARVDRQVMGCGILLKHSATAARIVRMTVAQPWQRQGLGGQILNALLAAAKASGHNEVLLETTSNWASAVSFYLKHGFERTKIEHDDQHFRFAIDAVQGNFSQVRVK